MKNNEFHELVIRKLDDLTADMKQVRTIDIPAMQTSFAEFKGKVKEQIKSLEKRTSWSSRLYTVLGGALAVLAAKFTGTTH